MVAIDPQHDDAVVGFLAITRDIPLPFGVPKDRGLERMQWAKGEASAVGFPSDVAAWVAGCGVKGGYEKVAVAPMLKTAFQLLPHLDGVLIAAPPEVEREPVGTSFVKMARTMKFALYAASRESVLPRLRVRRARVDDHDDLLPLVMSAAGDEYAAGGPLSRLPDGERQLPIRADWETSTRSRRSSRGRSMTRRGNACWSRRLRKERRAR